MSGKQKGCQGREVFSRMNFLYQASSLMVEKNPILACHYGNLCKSVGKKTVLRMEPKLKRTLCKMCGIVLKPGITAELHVKGDTGNDQVLRVTCIICKCNKNFVLNPHYNVWLDNPKSVVAKISSNVGKILDTKITNEGRTAVLDDTSQS